MCTGVKTPASRSRVMRSETRAGVPEVRSLVTLPMTNSSGPSNVALELDGAGGLHNVSQMGFEREALILMADSRIHPNVSSKFKDLLRENNNLTNLSIQAQTSLQFHELAYLLNGAYASHFGYDFAYVEYSKDTKKDCPPHENINWCKLELIRNAIAANDLPKYRFVLYLDTDAYLEDYLSIPQFLDTADSHKNLFVHEQMAKYNYLPKGDTYEGIKSKRLAEASLVVPAEMPDFEALKRDKEKQQCFRDIKWILSLDLKCGFFVNAGVMLWQSTSHVKEMLDTYIKEGRSMKHEAFDAEQAVLRSVMLPRFSSQISLINQDTMSTLVPRGKWVTHASSNWPHLRIPKMSQTFGEHAFEIKSFLQKVVAKAKDGKATPGVVSEVEYRADLSKAMREWHSLLKL